MKNLTKLFETGKRKITVLSLTGAMLLATGGTVAFAASQQSFDKTGSIDVRQEDGRTLYSTDEGKSWSETVPEGLTASDDGTSSSVFIGQGDAPAVPESGTLSETSSVSIKEENGKTLYSTDGGKTWSDEVPEGFSYTTDADGVSYFGPVQ